MHKLHIRLLALLFVLCFPVIAIAHSGRTDASGGHKDNKNKSGLGYYHYHCGGHPPHLHDNGVCPYGASVSYTPAPKAASTVKPTTKPTSTPKPTNTPKPTTTPKPSPTATPKPTNKAAVVYVPTYGTTPTHTLLQNRFGATAMPAIYPPGVTPPIPSYATFVPTSAPSPAPTATSSPAPTAKATSAQDGVEYDKSFLTITSIGCIALLASLIANRRALKKQRETNAHLEQELRNSVAFPSDNAETKERISKLTEQVQQLQIRLGEHTKMYDEMRRAKEAAEARVAALSAELAELGRKNQSPSKPIAPPVVSGGDVPFEKENEFKKMIHRMATAPYRDRYPQERIQYADAVRQYAKLNPQSPFVSIYGLKPKSKYGKIKSACTDACMRFLIVQNPANDKDGYGHWSKLYMLPPAVSAAIIEQHNLTLKSTPNKIEEAFFKTMQQQRNPVSQYKDPNRKK